MNLSFPPVIPNPSAQLLSSGNGQPLSSLKGIVLSCVTNGYGLQHAVTFLRERSSPKRFRIAWRISASLRGVWSSKFFKKVHAEQAVNIDSLVGSRKNKATVWVWVSLSLGQFGSVWVWASLSLGQFGSVWVWVSLSLGQFEFGSVWVWVNLSQLEFGPVWVWVSLSLGQFEFGPVWVWVSLGQFELGISI